ncbi:MAG: MFS transporter [Actinomycetota bacterium]|nr:MFS transporter [Actinomycetota bacterium]
MHNAELGGLFQAALIIVAQLVMIPMAIMIAKRAGRWGRKKIFLAAFAVLPIRGALFALAGGPGWVIAIQVLDGVGAGIFMTMFTLVIADLTRGTGRFNLALGAATTVQGIDAALSTTLAGAVIVAGGFTLAFLVLAAVALVVFVLGVPETADISSGIS